MPTRKEFVAANAGVLSTSPEAAAWSPPYLPVLKRAQYDYAAMMRVIQDPAEHKQLFLSNPSTMEIPGVAATFQRMQAAWNAYEFSLAAPPATEKLAVAAVLIATPIVFALNDTMWRKYHIGTFFKITDRYGKPATFNVTARAWSDLDLSADPTDSRSIYHDYTSPALLKRGARFLVCHNAIAGVGSRVARATGVSIQSVVADWTRHTLPGFTVVAAGGMAVQLAQEHGWRLYPVTD